LAPDTFTVYTVDAVSAALGVKAIVWLVPLVGLFVPGTAVPPGPLTPMTAVEASSGSLNVALTGLLVATPVAPEAGTLLDTVGGVVSAADAVVKLQVRASMTLPAASFAPVTVPVYVVELASADDGENVIVVDAES